MDYNFGAPRQPPTPPTINTVKRVPVVPEVSVFENPMTAPFRNFQPLDYNTAIRPQHAHDSSKSQFVFDSSLIAKKQVRFKSFDKENIPEPVKNVPNLNGKTFKQIYMANVPDRHLDLSIFEPQKNYQENQSFGQLSVNRENSPLTTLNKVKSVENTRVQDATPVSYKQYKEKQLEQANFFKDSNKTMKFPKLMENCTQTDPSACTEIAPKTDEPTIKDLYHIIQQQNEQIMLLQRQVNNLKSSIRHPELEPEVPRPFIADSPTKKGLFSFDVKATSYEFSFRPQQKFKKQNDFLEPRIQEIVEGGDRSNSLRLEDDMEVKDSYVSAVQSIAIEMDKYQSSDEEEESEIGLSFYKDLMNQVNNVLKRAQKKSECQLSDAKKQEIYGQTMKGVKQATLQHLKNIGVNLSPIQESSENTGTTDLDESDISCAVQQLLMKYLPPDKLAKVVNRPKEQLPKAKNKKFKQPNAEFSVATLQYMQKYNLVGNTGSDKKFSDGVPKILDVTALKMQPKLS